MSNDFTFRYDFFPTTTSTSFEYPEPTKTVKICQDKFGGRHECPEKSLVGPLVGVFVGLAVLLGCIACFVRHQRRRKGMESGTSTPLAAAVDQPPSPSPPPYSHGAPIWGAPPARHGQIEMQRPGNVYHGGGQ
ncbi:hypothetical protein GX51_02238 [Blastomyces parvus]|uniref:Uncharacterized protein n=1 Tax=Blastomyces parvus TaxID=2060905 RepID=A0A2B7XCX0_9EURO|nr:hypothetical protein GX51_02238 [Blastomyces parvus]